MLANLAIQFDKKLNRIHHEMKIRIESEEEM